MEKFTVGIEGLGLIGASFARGFKKRCREVTVLADNRTRATLDKALEEDKDAIASEMIRQAGRVYRGELSFPKAAFSEVYCEGKTLKERFFYFVKTNCIKTGKVTDVLPLRILIDAYKEMNPDESLPYGDKVGEERAFGSLLKYVCNLDSGFVQGKKKVNGYPNPVSCLIGCKMRTRFQQSKQPKAEKPEKNTSGQYTVFRNRVTKNW